MKIYGVQMNEGGYGRLEDEKFRTSTFTRVAGAVGYLFLLYMAGRFAYEVTTFYLGG